MLKINYLQRLNRMLPVTQLLGNALANIPQPRHISRCTGISATPARKLHVRVTLRKYDKNSSRANNSDSDDDDQREFKDERDSKVLRANVNSLRADLLLKSGLGLARNKIETIFYESKIRVNGRKLSKKSMQLNVGDEIDVIRGFSQANSSHLVVARVVILASSEREEGLSVNLRRYKSLLIENYAGANAYKSSEAVLH